MGYIKLLGTTIPGHKLYRKDEERCMKGDGIALNFRECTESNK